MSTSLLYHAFGVSGVNYTKTEFIEGSVLYYGIVQDRLFRCTPCRSRRVIKFGHKVRIIRLVPTGNKQNFLYLTTHRIKCKKCGQIRWISLPFVEGQKQLQ